MSYFRIVLLALVFCYSTGNAQILLKPNGQNAAPLRVKALTANVKISGQFAQTQLIYTFQNETSERIEADFIYTVPAHAVVTYFAYWYGDEKVVARVVEKERAAQIYQYITTRQRDPALVEMIGKNTFRARIFPVMPNADLKVELHTVQVLPSDKSGAVYTLPLSGPEPGKGTFEELEAHVEGVLDKAFSGVSNNFSMPMTAEGAKFDFTLKQSNYRAPRDLKITLKPRKADLRSVVFAKKTGAVEGYFALALSSSQAMSHPRISISGVKTSEIAPLNPAPVAAFGTLLITGRYRGNGNATAQVSDGAKSWRVLVPLSNATEANHLATKLWAARRIEDLSRSKKNQKTVMALSLRFTLPSRWTSWLAIPKAELERYKTEKARADRDYYGHLLAVEYAQGRSKGTRARQLRMQFDAASRTLGEEARIALKTWAEGRLSDLSYEIEAARGKERARIVTEIRALSRVAGLNANDFLNRARAESREERLREARQAQAEATATKLARELLQRGETTRARQLKIALEHQARLARQWAPGMVADQVSAPAQQIAAELVRERMRPAIDQRRVSQLLKKLDLLTRYSNGESNSWITRAESSYLGSNLNAEASELVRLRHSDDPDRARLQELEHQFAGYEGRLITPENMLKSALYQWANEQMHTTSTLLAAEKLKPQPDTTKIADLQKQFDKALEAYPDTPKEQQQRSVFAQHFFDLAESSQFNRAIEGLQSALQLDEKERPSHLRQAREQFTRVHTALGGGTPNPLESSDMRAMLNDAEQATGFLPDEKKNSITRQLYQFMRWGDPLISVEAPQDSLRVVALLPGGEIKPLTFNAQNGRWEARFDIPTYAPEGDFPITVVIVAKDGQRRTLKLNFRVDGTAPKGNGRASLSEAAAPRVRLEWDGDADTTRVSVLLPWGDKIELAPSMQRANGFFAVAGMPAAFLNHTWSVTYIVTDRAHNRTTVTVDMEN